MVKNHYTMKRNVIRKIVGGISFTSALFVFQACYGTPQDFRFDVLVEGQVKAKSTGLPIKGIRVAVADQLQYELTDSEGKFSFYAYKQEGLKLQFKDADAAENGVYLDKDTVLTGLSDRVSLEILLEEH